MEGIADDDRIEVTLSLDLKELPHLFDRHTADEQIALWGHQEGNPILTSRVPRRFPFLSKNMIVSVTVLNHLSPCQLLQDLWIRNVSPVAPERTVCSPNKVHSQLWFLL